MDVEGVQELDQPSSLKRRQPQSSRKEFHTAAAQTPRESERDVETKLEHRVQRQENSGTLKGLVTTRLDDEPAVSSAI